MFDSFTSQLRTFSMSVDSVEQDTLDRVSSALYDYLVGPVGACYHEFCIQAPDHDARPGDRQTESLQILFCRYRRRIKNLIRLMGDDGQVRSQKAYCYLNRKLLWVHGQDEAQFLKDCANPDDLVVCPNEDPDLPPYRDYEDDNTGTGKTSILMPLNYERQPVGVANIEFPTHIPYNRDVRDQLESICNSVATLYGRHLETERNKSDTSRAFHDIMKQIVFEDCGLSLHKPVVFFSYSSSADNDVVGVVSKVLHKEPYCDRISVFDWRLDAQPGPISANIVDQIRSSRLGVCYLSERANEAEGADVRFVDNPNVLFEAGMFHILRRNRGEQLEGWLPIREDLAYTTEIPFNFAADRILVVPRNNGQLNEPLFVDMLENHLNRLLGL